MSIQPLGRHLIRLFKRFEGEILESLRAGGYPTLTAGHLDLLRHLDNTGMRAVDLARDAGVSRQAAAKMVQAVETMGWVKREVDPDDARSFRVLYTDQGLELIAKATELVADAERAFAEELGKKRYDELKSDLERLESLYS